MILLEAVSNKIDICEALMRRGQLLPEEFQLIENMIKRHSIGLEGEYQLKWFCKDLALSDPHLLLFNYETVKYERFHYQMDAIFLCERFVLILENKHIAGEIYYDEKTNQLWRLYNGERLSLNDPFSQVMRHEDWMAQFLSELNIAMPVLTAVVITTNSSSLHNMPEQFMIFKLPGLRIKLQQLFGMYPRVINQTTMHFIGDQLMKSYKQQKWLHPFKNIVLRNGALCMCGQVMTYKGGKFSCRCGYISKEPLLQGLHDYRLLVSEWITNRQFRAFFNIENEDVANKILKRFGFEAVGRNKARKYLIDENIWRNKDRYM